MLTNGITLKQKIDFFCNKFQSVVYVTRSLASSKHSYKLITAYPKDWLNLNSQYRFYEKI